MRLYHGTWAGLAQAIHQDGLHPKSGYVHLASTVGLAWAYGAWSAGLVMSRQPAVTSTMPRQLLTGQVGSTVRQAFDKHGPAVAAVATIDVPDSRILKENDLTACPALPWEDNERVAPCFRTDRKIPPTWIVQWALYGVAELREPGMLARLRGEADEWAAEYPRGDGLLEDLSPDPIGAAIPNGRRLLADVLDAASPATRRGHHGLPHWHRVAARGIDLHPDADPVVVLLFALLHDAQRDHDGDDPDHGRRAAALAEKLNGAAFTVTGRQLDTLKAACAEHADGLVSDDPTIGACWDADRLDLVRFKQQPAAALLSTERARALAADVPLVRRSVESVLDSYRSAAGCVPTS